ncbi:hypothetical protein CWI59_03320, partial [Neisseria meningitidis]
MLGILVGAEMFKRDGAVGVWAGRLGRGGGSAKFSRSAAKKEAGRGAGISQAPCEQGGGGRFAVRPRHTEYP